MVDYKCKGCGRRLPIRDLSGEVQAWCRHCKAPTLVQAGARIMSREQC